MKEIFEKIWEAALPYQDQRDDDGHARTALKYAKQLLELEGGDEDIVLPAIILHDIGYSQLPRPRRMMIFSKHATPYQRDTIVHEHQTESVILGKKILEKLNYPADLIPKILEIISQHDSRKGFISKEDGLMRDADKLWRFSGESFSLGKNRPAADTEERCKRLEKDLENPDFIYAESAKRIAREELEQRRKRPVKRLRSSMFQSCGMDIEYTVTDEHGLDQIEGLWLKLRNHHAGISSHFSESMKEKTYEDKKRELLAMVETGKLRICLAADAIAKKTVGYCIASVTADGEGEINSIFIEEDYRQRDIGENLMQYSLDWLQSFSPGRIRLEVMAGNEEVFRFYRRFGFEPRSIIMERVNQADGKLPTKSDDFRKIHGQGIDREAGR